MASKTSQLQGIVKRYQLSGNEWPASMATVAEWTLANNLWAQHPAAALRQCTKELSRAMREEMYTDPSGNRVRTKHVVTRQVNGAQVVLWDDIRSATRSHMELSLRQRRERIVGDCRQLKIDVDSYNATHPAEAPIQIVFNFINDLLELEAASAA
ncbi:MAG: hypothetical protein WEE89_13010 [Gemmatimonadota bacterium]